MKVWRVINKLRSGAALVAANSEKEAIRTIEEHVGDLYLWTSFPQYCAEEYQDLIYNQDSPRILFNYLDV